MNIKVLKVGTGVSLASYVRDMSEETSKILFVKKQGLKIGTGISLAYVRDMSEETSKTLFSTSKVLKLALASLWHMFGPCRGKCRRPYFRKIRS